MSGGRLPAVSAVQGVQHTTEVAVVTAADLRQVEVEAGCYLVVVVVGLGGPQEGEVVARVVAGEGATGRRKWMTGKCNESEGRVS